MTSVWRFGLFAQALIGVASLWRTPGGAGASSPKGSSGSPHRGGLRVAPGALLPRAQLARLNVDDFGLAVRPLRASAHRGRLTVEDSGWRRGLFAQGLIGLSRA